MLGYIALMSSLLVGLRCLGGRPPAMSDDDHIYDLEQFVFSDHCRDKDASFCNSSVENSVCNLDKNECFCKKGFVVIKEGKKIICKPLLTDLGCRVDRDCVHVGGSMCHPGAGQCVCPSKHVFIPQIFLCRKKYEGPSSENRLCKMCRQSGGECFRYDFKDTRSFGPEDTVGCSCSGKRALISNEFPTILNICTARLVDIGATCNNKEIACRSLKASCVKSSPQGPACKCLEGHVPVFQTNLHYHECFPIIDVQSPHPRCAKCLKAGGQCYDLTSSQVPDGCICPSSFSNIEGGTSSLSDPCSIKHLTTMCKEDNIKICFRPYTLPPYESLKSQLRGSRANFFIRYPETLGLDQSSQSRRDKVQIHSQVIQGHIHFCAFINVKQRDGPIKIKQIQEKVEYEGILEIVRDAARLDATTDISIPFKCDIEGKLPGTTDSGLQDPLQLELRVLDSTKNSELITVHKNTHVVLDVTLIDSRGFYTDLFIGHCSISNGSQGILTQQHSEFIYHSCNESSPSTFVVWRQVFPGIHYQTGPLLLSRATTWQGEVFIQCQISLCRSHQSCHRRECNGEITTDIERKSFARTAKVTLVEKLKGSLENTMVVVEDVCPFSLCLNQFQAVMTSALLLLLLFLVVILLTILFKRQRTLQRYATTKKKIPQNVTSYRASGDFVSGFNQNFYLLTDNNSITNSTDNYEGYETTTTLRDTASGGSLNLRSEACNQFRTKQKVPYLRRSIPIADNSHVFLTTFHTMPCTRVKRSDGKVNSSRHKSNDNLLNLSNLDTKSHNNKSSQNLENRTFHSGDIDDTPSE